MIDLAEDALKRAISHNRISLAYEILLSGQVAGFSEENVPEGATVLHLAVLLGYTDCVQFLLSRAHSDLWINFPDETSHATPLLTALACRERACAKLLLLSNRCDVTVRDCYGQTALHVEAVAGVGQGEEEAQGVGAGGTQRGRRHTADVAFLLVKCGAVLDARDAEGMTPFLRAVEANNVTVAKFLYSQRCDWSAVCHVGRSAVHIAAQQGHRDMLEWLLRIGCPVNGLTTRGETALMLVVVQRRPAHLLWAIMRRLLHAGCPINAQDHVGNTGLLLATCNTANIRSTHVELLLQHGACPDIANSNGLTPLWQLVYAGSGSPDRLKCCELLLARNCALNTACRGHLLFTTGLNSVYSYENDLSPVEVAIDSGFYGAARLLLRAGAQISSDLLLDSQVYTGELAWLHVMLHSPHELQQKCRTVVRALLATPIYSKVQKLPLPDKLKNYILFHDVLTQTAWLKE